MKTISKEKLETVATRLGGRAYPNYSGRMMFGKSCVGISLDRTPDRYDFVEATRGLRSGLTFASMKADNLGRGVILYWEYVQLKEGENK